MGWTFRRPCAQPGCRARVDRGYCHEHTRERKPRDFTAIDARRGSRQARGYDASWRKLRDWHLTREPLCRRCQAVGRVTAATVVDHIVPISEDPSRRLDPTNLQSLDERCHALKTREDIIRRQRE